MFFLFFLSKREVASHSSVLTNRRLDNIIGHVVNSALGALPYPGKIEEALQYFYSCFVLWLEAKGILTAPQNKEIKEKIEALLNQGHKDVKKIRLKGYGKVTAQEVIDLTDESIAIHSLMNDAFNNVNYLFKFSVPEVKGLTQSLAFFDDLSVFGGGRKTLQNGKETPIIQETEA